MEILDALLVLGIPSSDLADLPAQGWAKHVNDDYKEKAKTLHPDAIRRDGSTPTQQQESDFQKLSQARDFIISCIHHTLGQPFGEWYPYPGCKEAMRLGHIMSRCAACNGECMVPGKCKGHGRSCPFRGRRFFSYDEALKKRLFRGVVDGKEVGEIFDDYDDELAKEAAKVAEAKKMKRELEGAQERDRKAQRIVARAQVAMFQCCYVSMLLCFNVAMFQCCYDSMLLCFNVALFQCCYVSMLLCFNVAMFQCCYVSLLLCFNVAMFQGCEFWLHYIYIYIYIIYIIYVYHIHKKTWGGRRRGADGAAAEGPMGGLRCRGADGAAAQGPMDPWAHRPNGPIWAHGPMGP